MAHTSIKVNQALRRAGYILNRHPGYSMENRGTYLDAPFFDCSSFVGTVWDVPGRPATPSMASVYAANGFDVYAYGSVNLKKGDILVYNGPSGGAGADGHTCMIWNDSLNIIESTGGIGVRVTGFYYYGWQIVIRGQSGIDIVRWDAAAGSGKSWHKRGY